MDNNSADFFKDRVNWVKALIYFLLFFIVLRAFYLQVIEHDNLDERAQVLAKQYVSQEMSRGKILDREGGIISSSVPVYSLFANPSKVKDPEMAKKIMRVAFGNLLSISEIDNKDSNFVWIKRYISDSQKEFIDGHSLDGVHMVKEYKRVYLRDDFASQLIGITGYDSEGLEGIEYQFNDQLNGTAFTDGEDPYTTSSPKDVKLTISGKIQYFAESALKNSVQSTQSQSGFAAVMDSKTGAILALASYPSFNPNRIIKSEAHLHRNRAVTDAYEPGSTFKIITMSIARQWGYIKPDDKFFCENGRVKVMDDYITDVVPHGTMNLSEIIKKSSNICMLKIGLKIPKDILYEKIRAFGFGSRTGINLPAESAGVVHDFRNWTELDQANLSFGHHIQVTPIQILAAINTIANGGVYVRPYVIDFLIDSSGKKVPYSEPFSKKILDKEIADEITNYMIAVTKKGGTGYNASVPGVTVAGKTGTTKKIDPSTGKYSSKNHIRSFVGFLPAENPQLTIIAILNEPRERYRDSLTSNPLFREIAEKSLHFFNPRQLSLAKVDLEKPYPSERTEKNPQEITSISQLKGLSMREVIRWAESNDKNLKITGVGTANSVVVNGNEIQVKFK